MQHRPCTLGRPIQIHGSFLKVSPLFVLVYETSAALFRAFLYFLTSAGICTCAFAGTHAGAWGCACTYTLHVQVHTYTYVHVHVQLFMRSVESLGC